jgi:single-stranded DNA-specific DHH superfamily exonuclease
MITDSELKQLKEELVSSKKPILMFDDDTDGLCSYLLLYRFLKDYTDEIKGVILKTGPELDGDLFVQKVKDYDPDKVFILDKAIVSQDFIDGVHKKVIWLDHHPVLDRKNVLYFNPMKHETPGMKEDNRPTSYWAYKVVEKDRPQDMWLAAAGIVSDWHIPEFLKEFSIKYPTLLDSKFKYKNPGDIIFKTRLGLLIRIMFFNLKFSTKDSMISAKIISRINDPLEIIDQTTSAGKYIYKQYDKFNKIYERIKSQNTVGKGKLLVFTYSDSYSITSELCNELIYTYPKKFIIIARLKEEKYICSFRSPVYDVRAVLDKALVGIDGYGGGHEHACGGGINAKDWDRFLDNIRKEIYISKHHTK